MKEAQMQQPNSLGHFHRDMVSWEKKDKYYITVRLSCGHEVTRTKHWLKKYADSATLCLDCSKGETT